MNSIRSLIKKRFFWLIVFVLGVMGGIIVLAGGPAKGTVSNNLSASDLEQMRSQANTDTQRELELKRLAANAKAVANHDPATANKYDGDLFSFSYPGSYNVKEHTTAMSGTLEKIILSASDPISKVISVDISQTTAQTLSDLSGIAFRRTKKDIYTESPITINSRLGLVFTAITSEEGYEKVAYFLSNNLLTTLVFTSHAASDQGDEFDAIYKTFQWK